MTGSIHRKPPVMTEAKTSVRNVKTPARKLGFLVGEPRPKTLAEFGALRSNQARQQIHSAPVASVAQVTQVMPRPFSERFASGTAPEGLATRFGGEQAVTGS